MENKKLIVLFASCFSILFSLGYYFLFTLNTGTTQTSKVTLYMNQVGLYKKEESITSMKDNLKNAGLDAFVLKQDALTAVVSGVTTDQKASQSVQEKLKELKYTYIAKSVTVDDPEIVKLIQDKQYEQALDRIGK
ncbi:SPOR domain-containing protein [Amedibacillus sp. YH-ame10]